MLTNIPTATINSSSISNRQQATNGGGGIVQTPTGDIQNHHPTLLEEGMSLEQIICEDLKAFENRLVEIIQTIQPATNRWRWILGLSVLCTLIGSSQWLLDPETFQVSFFESLLNHKFFTISAVLLIALFCCGIHQRVTAPAIISDRVRKVIGQFNMSCDESGRLILMPRPNYLHEIVNGNHHHRNNHFR